MLVPAPIRERPVFTARERAYTWGDVVEAADARGEVARLEEDLAAALALLRHVDVDEDELDEAGVEFRRGLGLLAADEMEAWLARWELTAGKWVAFLRRRVARRHGEKAADDRDVEAAGELWAEAVCSGALNRWAWELAARAAAGGDAAYDALVRRADTPEARAKALEARQVDWLHVDFELLELPAEGMAREAALCVRDDGMSMQDVARQAGLHVAVHSVLLKDAPGELADPLLSATPGDLVGPVAGVETYLLALVRVKRPPDPDDPVIQELLDEEVPRRAVESEVKKSVRWHEHV